MNITLTRIALSCVALLTVSQLPGCGGGGSGSGSGSSGSPSTPTTSIQGVAATGAALLNAVVTLNYPTGSKACTANADTGAFTCDTTGLTGPYLLRASGITNETNITLTSAGTTNTGILNITPITHAIVATAVGGADPNTKSASDITANALNTAHDAYKTLLAPVMAATGNAGTSLLSGNLVAGNSAQDKLLDNLKVDVQPNGSIVLETLAGRSDDTPRALEIPAGAAASSVAVQDASLLPTTATIGGQSIDLAAGNIFSAEDLKRIQSILNACFDSTATQREAQNFDKCDDIVVDDVDSSVRLDSVPANYLSNGRNADDEFSPFVSSSSMDGARFALPEIVRVLGKNSAGKVNWVWIRLNWVRKDGLPGQIDTLAQIAVNPSSTDSGWRLVGNQRDINAFVRYRAGRRIFLNAATSPFSPGTDPNKDKDAYTNEIQTYVSTTGENGFQAHYAVITSGDSSKTNTEVGLPPAGLFLRRSSGTCEFLSISAQLTDPFISGDDITNAVNNYNAPSNCSTNFRIAGVAVDPAKTINWPSNNRNWLANPLQDTAKLAGFTKYRIRIYGLNTTVPARNYVVSVPTSMPSAVSLRNYVWHDLEASTLGSINPTSSSAFTGGNTFLVNWKNKANARPVGTLIVQILPSSSGGLVSVDQSVPFALPGVLQSASVVTPSGVVFPSVAALSNNGFAFVALGWTNPNGLRISSFYEYSVPQQSPPPAPTTAITAM